MGYIFRSTFKQSFEGDD